MTNEELDVLYQDIINANGFKKAINVLAEEYKNNNNSYALELLNKVVETCKNKILDNINDESFLILICCFNISTELNNEICDICVQYCKELEKNNSITQLYGFSAFIVYYITKDIKWYNKYLTAFCKTEVFADDNNRIVRRLKKLNTKDFNIALNVLIDGLNGNRQSDIQSLLKQLIEDDINPRIIFDDLLAKGIKLPNYLGSYLDCSSYIYDYDLIEVLLKNEDDDILKVLKDYTWGKYNLDHSNLLFLNSISERLKSQIGFPQFIQKLFENYKKFKESGSYRKLLSLNIKNLNKLINRIEKIREYSNTDVLLDESEMPELSNMLKQEIDNIYKKIVQMTSYEIDVVDLKDINIKFSYKEKKEKHNGVDIHEVIIQAKKVYDIMSNTCCECEKDCCLKGWFRDKIEEFLENPTIDNAKEILEVFSECRNSCINKDLRSEINKLRELIMSLSYILTIYGEYDNKNNFIILYLKNIYNNYPNDYGTILLNIFAHELFHAYHARCVEKNGKVWEDSNCDSIIVKESLASYFENEFSGRNANLAREWAKYTIDSWPYAGAKHFTPYDNSSYSIRYPNYVLFKYVFMESLKSLYKACEMIRFGEKMEFEDF